MDVDWCLSCERKLNDVPPEGPYCSPQCLSYAQPSSSALALHPLPRPDSGALRIRQWACAIPPHIPAGAPIHPFADLVPSSPSPSPRPSERPPSPRLRLQPTPKLIERTAACTPLPTLCVSSPAHVRPALPPRAHSHSYSQRTTTCMSEASTSLSSLLSEPMVATPDEDASFGANIGAFVRSWVGRDRANSTKSTNQEWVIEKVTDYFPALPYPKKASPPCKKPQVTAPHSPLPVARQKPPPKRAALADRERTTPTRSHTPTPVVFPSCRAWVDEDEQAQDELVAPRPQYHPSFYLKYDPPQQAEPTHWARAPSPSVSVASTGSSVLLIAPKRTSGVRGRREGQAIAT